MGEFLSAQFGLEELFIKILSTNPIRGNNRGVKVTWWFFPNWPFLPLPLWFLKHICKFPTLKGNFLPGVGQQFYKMVSKCILQRTRWSVRNAFVRNVASMDPVKWNIKLDPKVNSKVKWPDSNTLALQFVIHPVKSCNYYLPHRTKEEIYKYVQCPFSFCHICFWWYPVSTPQIHVFFFHIGDHHE